MSSVDAGPRSLVLSFLAPEEVLLNMNRQMNWAKKNRRTSELRNLAAYSKLSMARREYLQAADCVCLIEFRSGGRRDIHNWAPTAKAAIDGMVEGPRRRQRGEGLWPHRLLDDDSGRYLTGPDMREGVDPNLPAGKVRLTFTFTERERRTR